MIYVTYLKKLNQVKHVHKWFYVFASKIHKYIGSYAARMHGVDVIVFTAGIGENSVEIRAKFLKA